MFAYPLIFKNAVPPSKKHICRKLNGGSSTPKNFLHKGPKKKKKKTKPNPKLPVRGTSAEAEPVTGFWFWLWSWALGNGLRPACLPGTMEFKACTAKKQKNKRERERGREASRAFAAFINFEYKAALKNWTEKKNGAQNALTVFYTDTHRDTRAQLYVYYMISFFYFINTFFYFCFFGYAMQSSWAKLEIAATCNLHCPTLPIHFLLYLCLCLRPSVLCQ